jgi:hypothetical protein
MIWMDTCISGTQYDEVIGLSENLKPGSKISPEPHNLSSMKCNDSQGGFCVRTIIILPLERGKINVGIAAPKVL